MAVQYHCHVILLLLHLKPENCRLIVICRLFYSLQFNELETRLKSTKNRFQFSTGLNLKTLNTILNGTNHF